MVGQWGGASFLGSCILLILSSISFTKVLARHVLALKDPRLGGGAGLGEAGGQGDAVKLLCGQVRRQGSLTPDFL